VPKAYAKIKEEVAMSPKQNQLLGPYRVSCHRQLGVEIVACADEREARAKLHKFAELHPSAHITIEKVSSDRVGLDLITAITGQVI
jgi:hypothetical protein